MAWAVFIATALAAPAASDRAVDAQVAWDLIDLPFTIDASVLSKESPLLLQDSQDGEGGTPLDGELRRLREEFQSVIRPARAPRANPSARLRGAGADPPRPAGSFSMGWYSPRFGAGQPDARPGEASGSADAMPAASDSGTRWRSFFRSFHRSHKKPAEEEAGPARTGSAGFPGSAEAGPVASASGNDRSVGGSDPEPAASPLWDLATGQRIAPPPAATGGDGESLPPSGAPHRPGSRRSDPSWFWSSGDRDASNHQSSDSDSKTLLTGNLESPAEVDPSAPAPRPTASARVSGDGDALKRFEDHFADWEAKRRSTPGEKVDGDALTRFEDRFSHPGSKLRFGKFEEHSLKSKGERPLVWVHVHKAGGTLMCKMAKLNEHVVYPNENCNWKGHDSWKQSGMRHYKKPCKDRVLLFESGGFTYEQIEREMDDDEFCDEFRYGVMLREPLSLMNSIVNFEIWFQRKFEHHSVGIPDDVEEWLKSKIAMREVPVNQLQPWAWLDNFQTRLLANAFHVPAGKITEEHLEKARSRLEKHNFTVHTLEDLPTRGEQLFAELGWKIPPFSFEEKVNKIHEEMRPFTVEEQDYLRSLNQFDYELYNGARGLE